MASSIPLQNTEVQNTEVQNASSSGEESLQSESIQGSHFQLLVLKTGSVYSGRLEFSGGKYIIHRNNGSSVRLNAGEVDFITHSMQDAYDRLFRRLQLDDVIGHQRLANWCLRNRQLESAKRELDLLKTISGDSAITRLLERQVNDLANPRVEQQPDQMAEHRSANGIRRLPKLDSNMATSRELMATVNSYDIHAIREFNRSVHSRIVNGCAAASCHGNAESPMRLWRVDNGGGIRSTGIQRNLHSITRYIDRNQPASSRLLRYTRSVHGGMESPAYDPDSYHYHAIRDWVLGVGLSSLEGDNSSSNPVAPAPQSGDPVSQTGYVDQPTMDGIAEQKPRRGSNRNGNQSRPPNPVDLLNPQTQFVPRDEFDPEIFNRKYANETGPSAQPAASKTRALPAFDENQ